MSYRVGLLILLAVCIDWPFMLLSVQPVSACVFFTVYRRRAGFLLALLYQGKEVCICALR